MDLLLGACFDTVLALPPLAMTTQALELLVAFGVWAKKIKATRRTPAAWLSVCYCSSRPWRRSLRTPRRWS